MNAVCEPFVSADSLHELSDIDDFFLTSAEHVKTEPADSVEQVL